MPSSDPAESQINNNNNSLFRTQFTHYCNMVQLDIVVSAREREKTGTPRGKTFHHIAIRAD